MMGMSVMDAVASLDWKHKYLMLMTSRGYLRVLVDQLLEEDAELQGVLSLQPQSMKALYLFESKMVCFDDDLFWILFVNEQNHWFDLNYSAACLSCSMFLYWC